MLIKLCPKSPCFTSDCRVRGGCPGSSWHSKQLQSAIGNSSSFTLEQLAEVGTMEDAPESSDLTKPRTLCHISAPKKWSLPLY